VNTLIQNFSFPHSSFYVSSESWSELCICLHCPQHLKWLAERPQKVVRGGIHARSASISLGTVMNQVIFSFLFWASLFLTGQGILIFSA